MIYIKNILVAGIAKSGKSTFCKMLCDNSEYNHIPLDYFTASMKRNYPEWGIKSDVVINNDTSNKLCILLKTVTEIIDDNEEKFIIDSAHIMPRDLIKIIDRDKWDVYFFGYKDISVEEKLCNIRKYSQGGWTAKRSDEELKNIIIELINISKEISNECTKYNISYIDTSYNFIDVLKDNI